MSYHNVVHVRHESHDPPPGYPSEYPPPPDFLPPHQPGFPNPPHEFHGPPPPHPPHQHQQRYQDYFYEGYPPPHSAQQPYNRHHYHNNPPMAMTMAALHFSSPVWLHSAAAAYWSAASGDSVI